MEKIILAVILAFAAGVLTMDYAQELRGPAPEPVRCLPCPDQAPPAQFFPSRPTARAVRA